MDVSALKADILRSLLRGRHREEDGPDLAYTPRGAGVLRLAAGLAQARGHAAVHPEHLLWAVLRQAKGLAARLVVRAGLEEEQLASSIDAAVRDPRRG